MTDSLKRVAQFVFSLALMVLFLYWAFQDIDLHMLISSMRQVSWQWIAIIIATALCTIALRAWRWLTLMRPFTRRVSLFQASMALLICYAANIVIPRSGEALRAVSLHWTCGTSIGSVLGTVVVERTLDMIWMVILVGTSILLMREQINIAFPWMAPVALGTLAICVLIITLLVLVSVYRDKAITRVGDILGHLSHRLAGLTTRFLATFVHGLEALHTRSAYAEIMFVSLLLNVGYLLIIYEAFLAFGFEIPPLSLGIEAALVVLSISSLGMVIPTAGGIGSYHFFFAESLRLLYATPAAAALACATVTHAIATVTYLVLGGPAFLIQRSQRRRKLPASDTERSTVQGVI